MRHVDQIGCQTLRRILFNEKTIIFYFKCIVIEVAYSATIPYAYFLLLVLVESTKIFPGSYH